MFLLTLAACLLLATACSHTPEEQRLRHAVAAIQAAAEDRQPAAVVEWVSADFIGSHGLDRARLRGVMQAQMLRRDSIGVTLGPLEVVLDGDFATVRFLALTTGGSGGLFPDSARGYRVISEWRLEDGQWRVFRAEWAADADAGLAPGR